MVRYRCENKPNSLRKLHTVPPRMDLAGDPSSVSTDKPGGHETDCKGTTPAEEQLSSISHLSSFRPIERRVNSHILFNDAHMNFYEFDENNGACRLVTAPTASFSYGEYLLISDPFPLSFV